LLLLYRRLGRATGHGIHTLSGCHHWRLVGVVTQADMQLRIQRAWLPGARQDLGSFDSEFVVGGIYHYYLQEQTKGSCDNLGARALSLDTIDKSETGSSFISLLVSVALLSREGQSLKDALSHHISDPLAGILPAKDGGLREATKLWHKC
jgi:hypothetical protein